MATLGTLPPGIPAARELLEAGSLWQLTAPLNLYSRAQGAGLATQAAAGRVLQLRDGARSGAPGESRRVCGSDCWRTATPAGSSRTSCWATP